MISDIDAKAIQERRNSHSTNGTGAIEHPQTDKQINLYILLKNKFKMDHRVKCQALCCKTLQKKTGEKLWSKARQKRSQK